MKRARAVLVSVALAVSALRAAPPPIEFAGVLTADGKTRVALTNKTTGTTRWAEPGEDFNGYRIDRYDAKEDAVFLKKDGEEIRLALVATKASPDTRPVSATATAVAAAPIPAVSPSAAAPTVAAPAPANPPLTPTGRDTPPPASYVVQAGDTWEKIAQAANVPVDELKRLNPTATGSSPPAGQTIRMR